MLISLGFKAPSSAVEPRLPAVVGPVENCGSLLRPARSHAPHRAFSARPPNALEGCSARVPSVIAGSAQAWARLNRAGAQTVARTVRLAG